VLLLVNHYRIRRRRLEERYAEQERINRELDQKVKERTAEIEKARKVAEEATKAKSLFLANMSHEIRTPLTGMLGMFSLLAKTKLNQNQRSFLDYSRTAAENLNQLVNDLLDVESIESGTLPLHETRFDPEKALAYVYHLFEERAKAQGLDFFLDIEASDPSLEVLGDRNRFIQIVTNLVSNALKYTESGSISLKLTIAPAEAQRRRSYTVTVSDTGIGIPKDKTGSIFESFTQLDTGYAKSSKGVGLGLAIVKQLVDAMDGTISVESSPGGTSFTVRLSFPVAPPQEEAEETERTTASDNNSGIGKILVCEDEGINRFYLGTLLQNKGFAVDVAANGREAVRLAESNDYSLILMDLGMPEIDGLEATRMIRAQGITVPIIALTAHSYKEDIDKCREAGMDDFLAKPILEPLLFKKIRTWIGDKT
jgi:signal transduction histidine kinase/CheY-like chemotaxis protein